MNKYLTDPLLLRDLLKYDAVFSKKLSIGDRTAVHQFIGQDIPLTPILQTKLTEVRDLLKSSGEPVPETRYNCDRVLEVYSY